MNRFIALDPFEFIVNPVNAIGKGWMTLNVDGPRPNAMTASWGAVSHLWNQPALLLFIRPERYTFELLEHTDQLTVCGFDPENYRKELGYLGQASGRDEDKLTRCGLTVRREHNALFFDQCRWFASCSIIYRQPMNDKNLTVPGANVKTQFYGPGQGWHHLFIARINGLFTREH